jgi:Family of unknown function (DUF6495)
LGLISLLTLNRVSTALNPRFPSSRTKGFADIERSRNGSPSPPKEFTIFARMKYRMLSAEEMEIFDQDFKHFAITNGVSNEEWIEMNHSNKQLATKLVEVFSDTVLQKVYEKMKYIEHRSAQSCLVFKFNEANIDLISISASDETVDLSTPESMHSTFLNDAGKLSIFRSTKAYQKVREEELHEMLQQGCVNSSEVFWLMLEKVME